MHHYECVATNVDINLYRVDDSEPCQLLRSGRGWHIGTIQYTACPEKKSLQFSVHNFNKFRHSFVICPELLPDRDPARNLTHDHLI